MVLLKYYDNVKYSFDRSSTDENNNVSVDKHIVVGTEESPKYPY